MRFELKNYPQAKILKLRHRMDSNYTVSPTGCWVWNLSLNVGGYGKVKFAGHTLTAHRLYYQLYRGVISSELVVDHLCRNRACINPDHLEPVTQWVNNARGVGVSAENLKKTHCKNGHEFTKENTIVGKNRRSCRACAKAATSRRDKQRTLEYHARGLNSKGRPLQRNIDYRFQNLAS